MKTVHLNGFTPGPKAVGSFVPKLARKAFEKFGFATAAVLTDWQSIVGPELAAFTAPERLRWPRPADVESEAPAAATSAKSRPSASSRAAPSRTAMSPRAGATLMLRVEPARALDVQYKTAQIIERINAYFGYQAVTEIRLSQAPIAKAPAAKPMTHLRSPVVGPKAVLRSALGRTSDHGIAAAGIEDADLRRALERLGSAVSAAPHRHG